MKKYQKIILHTQLLTFMVPCAVLYAQSELPSDVGMPLPVDVQANLQTDMMPQSKAPTIWQRAYETIKAQLPTMSLLRDQLPDIKSSLMHVASLAKQKSHCLVQYEACTKRDKLVISNVAGFLAGYGTSFVAIMDQMFPTRKLTFPKEAWELAGRKIQITRSLLELGLTLTFLLFAFARIETSLFELEPSMISSALSRYLYASNKKEWLQHNIPLVILTLLTDAPTILSELAFAFRDEGKLSLRNVARYLKMNAQCIWSETYCIPKEQAESRRNGLYFWLGFLEGTLAYQLKIRMSRSPLLPGQIKVSQEIKKQIEHLRGKKGNIFTWNQILNVKSGASRNTIAASHYELGLLYPDAQSILDEAYKNAPTGPETSFFPVLLRRRLPYARP